MNYSSSLPDFPTNVIVAQTQSWVTPSQLANLVSNVLLVYFPIADLRNSGFNVLSQFLAPAPFSLNPPVRFPAVSAYVSTLDPVFNRILSQLLQALSYKDRLVEKTNIGNTICSTTSNTPQYLIALHSFSAAKLELINYIANYNNYIDRAIFENTYSLTWS